MRHNALCCIIPTLLFTALCPAATKVYQSGKLLDSDSQSYTNTVTNGVTGQQVNVRLHENRMTVEVEGIIYVGECEQAPHLSSCKPEKWVVGGPVEVRFEKDNMYMRDGSREVKTHVVKRMKAQ